MDGQVPAGRIRCPNCGALNPEGAAWCGQCHERFRAPEPPAPPPPPPAQAPGAAGVASPELELELEAGTVVDQTPGTGVGAPAPAAVGTKRGAFEVTEGGIQWTCGVCGSRNPIDSQTCDVCGAPFADTVRDRREDHVKGDPNNAAMYSLFFPGAGHGYLGLWGDAIARAVISSFTVGVAVISFFNDAPLVTFVFGLLAFGLWLVAAHDAFREASHQPGSVIIRTRHYGFLMLGILGLLFAMLMITYLGLRAQR